jgi:hypothetical protein
MPNWTTQPSWTTRPSCAAQPTLKERTVNNSPTVPLSIYHSHCESPLYKSVHVHLIYVHTFEAWHILLQKNTHHFNTTPPPPSTVASICFHIYILYRVDHNRRFIWFTFQ